MMMSPISDTDNCAQINRSRGNGLYTCRGNEHHWPPTFTERGLQHTNRPSNKFAQSRVNQISSCLPPHTSYRIIICSLFLFFSARRRHALTPRPSDAPSPQPVSLFIIGSQCHRNLWHALSTVSFACSHETFCFDRDVIN